MKKFPVLVFVFMISFVILVDLLPAVLSSDLSDGLAREEWLPLLFPILFIVLFGSVFVRAAKNAKNVVEKQGSREREKPYSELQKAFAHNPVWEARFKKFQEGVQEMQQGKVVRQRTGEKYKPPFSSQSISRTGAIIALLVLLCILILLNNS